MNLDGVFPVWVAGVADVPNLQQIIAGLIEALAQKRIGEERVVRGRDGRTLSVADRQNRIAVLLQVMNPIPQPLRANMKNERLSGVGVELDEVHILSLFDAAADRRRQG